MDRVRAGCQADMTTGQRFLDQNAFAMSLRVIQYRLFVLLVEVVGDHCAVTLTQRQQAAFDGLAGKAEATNLAFAFEVGERLIHLGVVEDRQIVAVRMHQNQIEKVSFKTFQAALYRCACMGGAEVMARLAVGEFLANLADDNPVWR